MRLIAYFLFMISRIYNRVYGYIYSFGLGYRGKRVVLHRPAQCSNPQNLLMYDDTSLMKGWYLIAHTGRLIMKEHSSAACGLVAITGNHHRTVGRRLLETTRARVGDDEKDIILEEEVWVGANVSLLPGVTIGRGSTISAGAVVSHNIPPYSIVKGNPAKVVGFTFTPEEVIEHEKAVYPEEKRLPKELIERNYEKYLLKRTKEIKEYTKL